MAKEKAQPGEGFYTHFRLDYVLALGFFIGAGFLVYFPSLKGAPVFDDLHTLSQNPFIKVWAPKQYFTDSGTFSAKLGNNPYRPLVVLSYALDWKMGSGKWPAFHLTNILLHSLAAFFLLLAGEAIFKSKRVGLISGWLFLIHPLPGFSVNYLSARSGILAGLFLLISLDLWLKWKGEGRSAWRRICFIFHLLFFGFALGSKLDAVILIPIITFLDWFMLNQRKGKALAKDLLPSALILLGFLVIYHLLAGSLTGPSRSAMIPFYPRGRSVIAGLMSPAIYFFKFLFPNRLTIFPALPGRQILLTAMAAMIYLSAFTLILFFRNRKWGLVLTWYFSALIPLLFLRLNILLAWHRGYLASIALGIGFGLFLDSLLTRAKKASAILLILTSMLLAGLSRFQSQAWRDPYQLWREAVKQAPNELVPHNYLAMILIPKSEPARARKELEWAIRLGPDFADAHNSLGILLFQQGEDQGAREEFEKACRLDPENYIYLENLIMTKFQLREIEGMDQLFQKLLDIAPITDVQAQKLYRLYLEVKDRDPGRPVP